MPRSLTVREANFAAAYVAGRSARAAAIEVGVKPKSAAQIGSRLLRRPRVQEEIARVRSVGQRYDKTAARRGVARALRGVAMDLPAIDEFDWRKVLDEVVTDPAVVKAAAVVVGMVPAQGQLVLHGADGSPRIEQAVVYEPTPGKLVRAACVLDKNLAKLVEDRAMAVASKRLLRRPQAQNSR